MQWGIFLAKSDAIIIVEEIIIKYPLIIFSKRYRLIGTVMFSLTLAAGGFLQPP